MKIAIYQRKEMTTTRLLRKALEARGHEVITLNNLYFETTDPGKSLSDLGVDLVYYWNGAGTVGRVCVCDFLNKEGIKVINKGIFSDPLFLNKIYQSYKVAEAGILSPATVTQTYASYEKISEVIGNQFILKTAVGSQGSGVYLINNEEQFEEIKNELIAKELLFQELVPNSGDFRVHVVGGKSVCAYKRIPKEGNFKANVSLGGSMEKIEDQDLLSKLFEISEKVVSSFGDAEIIGVDLMQHSETGEIYFIEMNELPGIKKVKEVTEVDIADKVAAYFESII